MAGGFQTSVKGDLCQKTIQNHMGSNSGSFSRRPNTLPLNSPSGLILLYNLLTAHCFQAREMKG